MSLKLWICKRLTKRIESKERQILKLQIAIDTLRKWIKQDKKKLNKRLKELTDEESLEYGIQNGFIDDEEYIFINHHNQQEKFRIRRKKENE